MNSRRELRAGAALTGVAFLFHFTWEMAQVPLFANLAQQSLLQHAPICLAAAAGDVVLAASAYVLTALLVQRRAWIFDFRGAIAAAVWTALGLAATIILERMALSSGRWTYSPLMPTVAGVGVAPLLQWILVPVALLGVAHCIALRLR